MLQSADDDFWNSFGALHHQAYSAVAAAELAPRSKRATAAGCRLMMHQTYLQHVRELIVAPVLAGYCNACVCADTIAAECGRENDRPT